MIKRIAIDQLQPGMYVHDLNAGWIPHSQLRQRGRVQSQASVDKVRGYGITELYIDTERGDDVKDAPTVSEINSGLDAQLQRIAQQPRANGSRTEFAVELQNANRVHSEAKTLLDGALQDAKLGRAIDLEPVQVLAEQLTDSVLRNHDALACLTRIRDKDQYLLEHSVSLSVLMSIFAKALGYPREFLHDAVVGALLHDIGKILVPDVVLHKPGPLNAIEMRAMHLHAKFSRDLLRRTPGIKWLSVQIAAQHHEKLDGTGYPDGLKGDQISRPGRMVAICDIYDALTAERCYKQALPPTVAMRKLLEWSDGHLDHQLVQQFIRTMGVYPVGSLVRLSNERFGVVVEQDEHDTLRPRIRVMYDAKHAHYIPPQDLDLARPGNQITIIGAEDPREHGIEIRGFL